jgi:hypothetical protein
MTQLTERLNLSPDPRVREYLNRSVCQISDFQEPERVLLRVPLAGVEGAPALQKEVTLEYRSDKGPADNRPWLVRWRADGGLYPSFDGKLALEFEGETPVLVLAGEYEPPLGIAGQAFDAVIGAHIASATAREFLRSIAEKMDHERHVDEVAEVVRTTIEASRK